MSKEDIYRLIITACFTYATHHFIELLSSLFYSLLQSFH
jgi:hypothetical protein